MCSWMWYSAIILLFLRSGTSFAESNETTVKPIDEKPKPKTATDLAVPKCESNYDCAYNGVCHKNKDGYGTCLCPKTCPYESNRRCGYRYTKKCGTMGKSYISKYDIIPPTCHSGMCVCPPIFDDIKLSPSVSPLRKETFVPAFKCDKRELKVIGLVYPSSSVYKGSDVTMFCCINMDPNGFVDASGVFFIQNTTLMREATNHPFREDYVVIEGRPACWELEIKNAQPSDTGSYMCLVTANAPHMQVNYTIDFDVKAPRMIQKLHVESTEKSANVTWDSEEGSLIPIDLRLLRRTDNRGQEVFRMENATSPVIVENLRAATPYTLFVSGKDGAIPFEFTEHFTTKQKRPYSPKEEDVRMLNSGSSLYCEVEWKSPAETNGRIIKYFVSVRGSLRLTGPTDTLVADHFPHASDTDKRCANWDGNDSTLNEAPINPIDFSTEFYSCKFGPLKPNRNYSVMVWAENNAGKSQPAVFKRQCITNFAQPDTVTEPQSTISSNFSTFKLSFNQPPDETNGPISCFYIAVVPLHTNVSVTSLPPPSDIVMDSYSKVLMNNLHNSAAEKKRYFAYIAESYGEYPVETVIGDQMSVQDLKLCNVQYLSRYSAEDMVLQTGLKYTGFLIVRVDKQEDTKWDSAFSKGRSNLNLRKQRQLHLNGPAYGYSNYFKPVILDAESEYSEAFSFLTVLIPVLVFLFMVASVAVIVLYRRNEFLFSWCPLKGSGSKQTPERTLLKQKYEAVAVEDLPSEYIIRHRDSDFLFSAEYEAVPNFNLEATASMKSDNTSKNRYTDIRAFDETRVVLKKIANDDCSDYINANFIESWNCQKTFIAAQAPLDDTISDFWRMIWEKQSYLIVMVANLTEKSRAQCAKYWPEEAPIRYGDIIVKPVDQTYFCDYAVRTFDVINVNESSDNQSEEEEPTIEYANLPVIRNSRTDSTFGNCRRILQYHFINWNDFKAPECSVGLLRFINVLRAIPQFNESPVTIHCSAGVGRTGTFIGIDSMLDQCEAEGKAHVFEYVSKMRKQRNKMVQSLEQYVFIYKALAEWHLYGSTDIEEDNFVRQTQILTDPDNRDRTVAFNGYSSVVSKPGQQAKSALEEEFSKLAITLDPPLPKNYAANTENIMKNRFDSAVPYDRNRVVLSPLIGSNIDTTYYNASQIKGYFYPYIAAQDPISEATVIDFWRMIVDQRVQTVVMLTNEEDWSASEKYWPEDKSNEWKHGKVNVEVTIVEEEVTPFFVERTLKYTINANGGDTTTTEELVQYAFTGWPVDRPTPSTPEGVISLIGRILDRQSKLIETGPILMHCRDGSSETGIFCCISMLLLRLRAENRVDVFQTVKALQSQRAQMFTKFDQYAFCYKAVAHYISRPS